MRSEYIVACRRFPTSENNCQSLKRNSNRNLGLKKEVNPVRKRQNLRIDGTSRRAGRQALLGWSLDPPDPEYLGWQNACSCPPVISCPSWDQGTQSLVYSHVLGFTSHAHSWCLLVSYISIVSKSVKFSPVKNISASKTEYDDQGTWGIEIKTCTYRDLVKYAKAIHLQSCRRQGTSSLKMWILGLKFRGEHPLLDESDVTLAPDLTLVRSTRRLPQAPIRASTIESCIHSIITLSWDYFPQDAR